MSRKISVNLILNLIVPFLFKIIWFPNLYNAIFKKEYIYYDFEIKSFSEFFYYVYGEDYLIIYLLSLLLFLMPFQLLKDYYYNKGYKLSYTKKVFLLMLIIICCISIFGTFSNIWMFPYWHNIIYIIFSFFLSIILTTITYYFIDIKLRN